MQLTCRFYKNRLPETDDLVMVNVVNIEEMGVYVNLLEYNNTEGQRFGSLRQKQPSALCLGMILLTELSRRRIRSINKLIRVGRNEVVVVVRVDRDKGKWQGQDRLTPVIRLYLGYIDLSKRRVSPEDISKCEEKFIRGKTVRRHCRSAREKNAVLLGQQYSSSHRGSLGHQDERRIRGTVRQNSVVSRREVQAGGRRLWRLRSICEVGRELERENTSERCLSVTNTNWTTAKSTKKRRRSSWTTFAVVWRLRQWNVAQVEWRDLCRFENETRAFRRGSRLLRLRGCRCGQSCSERRSQCINGRNAGESKVSFSCSSIRLISSFFWRSTWSHLRCTSSQRLVSIATKAWRPWRMSLTRSRSESRSIAASSRSKWNRKWSPMSTMPLWK